MHQTHIRIKKGRLLLLLSIIIVIVSLLPLHRVLPAPLTVKGSTDLLVPAHFADGPKQSLPLLTTMVFDLNIESNFVVTDNFVIVDSNEAVVFGPEKIYNRYHL